ncbi:M23 family metallopeptidase [Afifella sp. JA880]|uniref:M23 family metallopeptidase n=1 Tax=Afifella sp. JA880 TaxID=2975280 RepID=UPI0021BAEADF|nr:M23 family metallopeptidase [Afifella sp. JA880]MCT8268921.1 M23 family metallopeptidase [Afifella sp. JA880]
MCAWHGHLSVASSSRAMPALTAVGRLRAPALALVLLAPLTASAAAFELELPLACTPGTDCFIQHYVDRDGTSGAHDYHCGSLTYDGHKGTDFRIPTLEAMREGVNVLAAAPGKVLRVRDKMDDVSVRRIGVENVKGSECGNGLVIDHGDGWQTQYCHMRLGSIVVRPGEQVEAGAVLGQVGLSGQTEFPHVHLQLTKDGTIVDPFSYQPDVAAMEGEAACKNEIAGTSLWAKDLRANLAYTAGSILNVGFSDRADLKMVDIEGGMLHDPDTSAPVLVAYGRAIGLLKDDIQHMRITAPGGQVLVDQAVDPLEANKAQVFVFAGRKRPSQGWPAGRYEAVYSVERDGETILEKPFSATLE